MQWSRQGAHLLIQVRAHVINEELKQIFQGWYKDFNNGANVAANVAKSNTLNLAMVA